MNLTKGVISQIIALVKGYITAKMSEGPNLTKGVGCERLRCTPSAIVFGIREGYF